VGSAMPSFANKLDDDSRWAVVAYLRSMTWNNATAPNATPAATSSATAAPESPTITVSGTITNGTPGGTVPATLPITLHVIATSGTPHDLATAQGTATNGKFAFPNVSRQIGQAYVITTQYVGVQQFSAPVKLAAGTGATLDLSFAIFDSGANAADIVVTQQTVILDFTSPTTITVNEGLNFQNAGQRIYLTDQTDATANRVSVRLPLPNGAQSITLDPAVQGQFEVVNGAPSSVVSTLPLFPTESRPLQFSYTLPLNGQLDLNMPAPYTVQAFNIYLPQQSGFAIADPEFPQDAPITLKDNAGQNVAYNGYRLANPSRAGTPIALTVAPQSTLQNADAAQRRDTLAVVVTLALCAFALIGAIVWRLNRLERVRRAGMPDAAVTLIAQIAALDDQFEAGSLPEADYEAQRTRLKTQLLRLMTNEHGS
ncbi:MAG: c-type cytochrome, partial [Aggregatilineales bacterium]